MAKLIRFSVSMDEALVRAFDRVSRDHGYVNRSEAIRDAIRGQLVRHQWEAGEEVAGVTTILYDHHRPGASEALTEFQHHALGCVISTTHVHLDHDNCLEMIAVRGEARTIERLADQLISLKSVKHGALTATSTGKELT
ncbi:MAG: nickel-responsive transcriptional regulator NikR [Candidatus Bipolaricaulis sp.]|nr:nickel-responsive transcriptional regulator NikR [Candidatus Bipolaricaulis sp.]